MGRTGELLRGGGQLGVRHSIAGGDYGLRRRQLEAGQWYCRGSFLSDVTSVK